MPPRNSAAVAKPFCPPIVLIRQAGEIAPQVRPLRSYQGGDKREQRKRRRGDARRRTLLHEVDERLHFRHMGEPDRAQRWIHQRIGPADAARLEQQERRQCCRCGCSARCAPRPAAFVRKPGRGNHRQPSGDGGGRRIDRERVANAVRPAIGTDTDEERRQHARREQQSIGPQRGGSVLIGHVAQRESRAAQHQERQTLEADRQGQSGDRTGCRRRPTHAIRPDRGGDRDDGEGYLHVVMIDAAGSELAHSGHAQHGKQQHHEGSLAPRQPPRDRHGAADRRDQPQDRPQRRHQPFGKRVRDEEVDDQKQAGESRVDQARPMGFVTPGRIEAHFVQVEPALARKERTDLDEPERIVRVVHRRRRHGPVLGHQLHQDEQPDGAEHQG
jgi:hypothetical protein